MINDTNNNLTWSLGKVKYKDRCEILNQQGLVVWFTGISGSGKSTIAIEVESRLIKMGVIAYRLDGDNIRYGLNSDLGFSEEERNENIRRVAEVSALFKDVGIVTLVSFISPYKKMREFAKEKIGTNNFMEIYIKADLKTCISRDTKGLYKKALIGKLNNLTGISSPYEEPDNPNLVIDTSKMNIDEAASKVIDLIFKACLDRNKMIFKDI